MIAPTPHPSGYGPRTTEFIGCDRYNLISFVRIRSGRANSAIELMIFDGFVCRAWKAGENGSDENCIRVIRATRFVRYRVTDRGGVGQPSSLSSFRVIYGREQLVSRKYRITYPCDAHCNDVTGFPGRAF